MVKIAKRFLPFSAVCVEQIPPSPPDPSPLMGEGDTVYTQVNCLRFGLSKPPKSHNSGGL